MKNRILSTANTLCRVALATLILGAVNIALSPAAIAQSSQSLSQLDRTCQPEHYGYLMSSDADSPINIRDGASVKSRARHIAYRGDLVDILGCTEDTDVYAWYKVRFPKSRAVGWVRSDFISVHYED